MDEDLDQIIGFLNSKDEPQPVALGPMNAATAQAAQSVKLEKVGEIQVDEQQAGGTES